MQVHPNDASLQETLGPARTNTDPVRLHLSRCARCRERLSSLMLSGVFGRGSAKLDDYGPVLERSFEKLQAREAALERERSEAPRLLSRLLGLPSGQRRLLFQNSRHFRSWGLFELLIRTGREETFSDPRRAEEILELALEVSRHLDASFYGREIIEDMRARTWGYIANARRARMDLQASEEAFRVAFQHLLRGTDDPLERAVLFDLQASLRRHQRQFDEAIHLSSRAIYVFRNAGDEHRMGRALVNQSIAHAYRGDHHQAISLLNQAFPLIDRDREPPLMLYALNNLIDDLAMAGRFLEAQRLLVRAHPLYERFSSPVVESRRLWVEAKIAHGLGHRDRALSLLVAARERIASSSWSFDAILLSRYMDSLHPTANGSVFESSG